MNREQFEAWLTSLVVERTLTSEQADDLARQRQLFDERRDTLTRSIAISDDIDGLVEEANLPPGVVVGFHADELITAPSVQSILAIAKERQPERMVYFEPIGFNPFGSAFGSTALPPREPSDE